MHDNYYKVVVTCFKTSVLHKTTKDVKLCSTFQIQIGLPFLSKCIIIIA
jgi:hypothetical protein